MRRIINTDFYNLYGDQLNGDAIVEVTQYDEDGKLVNEVTEVFLPEFAYDYKNELRQHIIDLFDQGEGYNL